MFAIKIILTRYFPTDDEVKAQKRKAFEGCFMQIMFFMDSFLKLSSVWSSLAHWISNKVDPKYLKFLSVRRNILKKSSM